MCLEMAAVMDNCQDLVKFANVNTSLSGQRYYHQRIS